jgi:hypothetical protein
LIKNKNHLEPMALEKPREPEQIPIEDRPQPEPPPWDDHDSFDEEDAPQPEPEPWPEEPDQSRDSDQ